MYCDCMQWFIFHATRLLFALTFYRFFLPLLHILCLLQFLLHLSPLLFPHSPHPSSMFFSFTSVLFPHILPSFHFRLIVVYLFLAPLFPPTHSQTIHVCWFYFLHPFLSVRSISLCEWMPESKEMNGPAFISRCVSSYTDMTPLVLHCP